MTTGRKLAACCAGFSAARIGKVDTSFLTANQAQLLPVYFPATNANAARSARPSMVRRAGNAAAAELATPS